MPKIMHLALTKTGRREIDGIFNNQPIPYRIDVINATDSAGGIKVTG